MSPQTHETFWLDARHTVDAQELARICGLSADDILELMDYGALAPLNAQPQPPVFSAACIAPLRQAAGIRGDFDLDLFTVAILLGYINRIAELETQLHALRAQAPSHQHLQGAGLASWHEGACMTSIDEGPASHAETLILIKATQGGEA